MNDDPKRDLEVVPTKQPKQQHVRVGVGVVVQDPLRPSAVFCGIRKGSHGAGSLALPGGHLEMMETWEACARREVQEEMGVDLDPAQMKYGHVTNDIMADEQKHYVTLYILGRIRTGTNTVPHNMEPHKCEGWKSYTWQELRATLDDTESPKLFGPLKHLIEDNPPIVQEYLSQTTAPPTK